MLLSHALNIADILSGQSLVLILTFYLLCGVLYERCFTIPALQM